MFSLASCRYRSQVHGNGKILFNLCFPVLAVTTHPGSQSTRPPLTAKIHDEYGKTMNERF